MCTVLIVMPDLKARKPCLFAAFKTLLCRWSEPAWLLDVEAASVLFPSSISNPRQHGQCLISLKVLKKYLQSALMTSLHQYSAHDYSYLQEVSYSSPVSFHNVVCRILCKLSQQTKANFIVFLSGHARINWNSITGCVTQNISL